jgi:hypothetical protein
MAMPKTRMKTTLLSAAILGSALLSAACGSSGSSPTSSAPSNPSPVSTTTTAQTVPTPTLSPSPTTTPGRTIVLNVTSNDGYKSTLSLTVSPPVSYEGTTPPPAVAENCQFTPEVGQGKYVYVAVTGQLVAKTANGFTWPEDLALGVNATSQDAAPCDGDPTQYSGAMPLTPGTNKTVWLLYEAQVTPDNPKGWDSRSPLPWSAIEVNVDNRGAGTYDCTVARQDRGYTPITSAVDTHGCDFGVGAR